MVPIPVSSPVLYHLARGSAFQKFKTSWMLISRLFQKISLFLVLISTCSLF
jgi:hypothetical protein